MHKELDGLEAAIDRLIADRSRLQALNAELVAALDDIAQQHDLFKSTGNQAAASLCAKARAALAKAKEQK